MKKLIVPAFVLGLLVLAVDSTSVGGPRGGGGRAVGGGRGGGAAYRGGSVGSYGGGAAARSSAGVVGPRGGTAQAGRAAGTYTTPRGTTVQAGGAAAGRTTPGGYQAGRAVGGVQVTTPGGRQATRVGQAGGVSGPGGRAVAGRESATATRGAYGGTAVRSSSAAAARGPYGGAAVGSRGGVVSGGYGAVGAARTTAVAGGRTYYRSASTIRTQGTYVRGSVSTYPCFRAGWYRQYPGAWVGAGWAAGAVWRAATWDACSAYCGIVAEPVYYDYGSNVGYQEDGVYLDGEKFASQEEYSERAIELATDGREAKEKKDDEWLPLGVFALAQGEEKTSNRVFQLAINKAGVIRGNFYDAITEETYKVYGSVDKKTQRAAWTVGERKTPVYEVGFANLTKDETTMVVHYGKDRSEQFTLIRLEDPEKKEE
jgi:hypothetical protein